MELSNISLPVYGDEKKMVEINIIVSKEHMFFEKISGVGQVPTDNVTGCLRELLKQKKFPCNGDGLSLSRGSNFPEEDS